MAKEIFDVHVLYVEFQGSVDGKVRPILIMDWAQRNPKLVYFYSITSQYNNKPSSIRENYYPIAKWKEANLDKPSFIDIHKQEAVSVDVIIADKGRQIGRLHEDDISGFATFAEERMKRKP